MVKNLSLALIPVLLFAFAVQAIFIIIDEHDIPNAAAAEFSKAYFMLDECKMAKYICKELKDDEAVGDYLYQVTSSASARGFDTSYLKNRLFHIQTDARKIDDTHAIVNLTGQKRKSINPIFELVGQIFCLIDTTDVKQEIHLIKEDGEWKVCGDLQHLS